MPETKHRELQMAAMAMIDLFGDEAPAKAAERAEEYQEQGLKAGHEFWTELAQVIRELLHEQRPT